MQTITVEGTRNQHHVLMYALSTCMWCRRTKAFLQHHTVAYEYIDVDLQNRLTKHAIIQDILRRGGQLTYPTLIIDDTILIQGYHIDKIAEALNL
jgi:glutaredoxin-like protein NrdH